MPGAIRLVLPASERERAMATRTVYLVKYYVQNERFIAGKLYNDYVVLSSAYGTEFENIRDMIAIKKGIAKDEILISSLEMSEIQ
jgi:hypothetical protein